MESAGAAMRQIVTTASGTNCYVSDSSTGRKSKYTVAYVDLA